MKLRFGYLPAAALALCMLASCTSTTFEVPKIGSRFEDTRKYLEYDTSLNMYVIPFDRFNTLRYERFDITVPLDEPVKYYAPALENSSNHAELYVRNLPPETDFFGRAICQPVLESWKNLEDIRESYREKFTANRNTINFDTKITMRDGIGCVEYDVMARLSEPGKIIAVHGFCMFDPENPGFFFELVAGRKAYQKDIDNDFLIVASGLFFEAVKLRR